MFKRILRRWFPHNRSMIRSERLRKRRPPTLESLEGRLLLAAPEITVLSGLADITEGSTTPIDFGSVSRSGTGPTQTFTVRNDGDATLSMSSLGLPSGYSLVEGLFSALVPRSSDTFTVRLNSATVGIKSGQITIGNNDDDENPFAFAITGTVLPSGPEITVLDGTTPIVDGAVGAISFGGVILNQTGPVRSFTVRNDGNQTLAIGTISFPMGFAITDPLPATIAPHTEDTLSFRLLSSATGIKSGEIGIESNDSDESQFNFPIMGVVTATAVPEITVLAGFTIVVSGSSTIDFGKVGLGHVAPTHSFTVRNDGTATLSLESLSVPAGFTLLDGLGTSLAPRATDTFVVQLDTATLATSAGQITFGTDDSDENPFHFTISGDVVADAPEIRVFHGLDEITDGTATETAFDTATQGNHGTILTFFVANVGIQNLTLGSITLPAGVTLLQGLPASLPAGFFSTLTVRLDSRTVGVKTGEISIVTNDADENPFNFPVTGTVLAPTPEITVKDGKTVLVDGGLRALEFGGGALGLPGLKRTFTVRNDGRGSLTLGSITLPTGFTLVEGLRPTLAPKTSDSFTVQLDTSVVGTFSGEISIINDDADEGPFSFSITSTVTLLPAPEITVQQGDLLIASGGATTIDFGTIVRRKTGPAITLTIRNDGSDFLNLGAMELPTGFILVNGAKKRLAPRGSDTIIVRLDARTVGTKAGLLIIHSDDSDEALFTIAITGTVVL